MSGHGVSAGNDGLLPFGFRRFPDAIFPLVLHSYFCHDCFFFLPHSRNVMNDVALPRLLQIFLTGIVVNAQLHLLLHPIRTAALHYPTDDDSTLKNTCKELEISSTKCWQKWCGQEIQVICPLNNVDVQSDQFSIKQQKDYPAHLSSDFKLISNGSHFNLCFNSFFILFFQVFKNVFYVHIHTTTFNKKKNPTNFT